MAPESSTIGEVRKPRIPLDTLMPQIDGTARSGGLDNFVESRRQNFREVRPVPVKHHQNKANARPKANNKIGRESAETVAQTGDLVFVKESSSSNVERNGSSDKFEHELGTSPWKITKVLKRGLDNQVVPNTPCIPQKVVSHSTPDRPICATPLPTSSSKFAWSADFGLTTPSVVAEPLYTLYGRRNVTSATGVPKRE